MPKFHFEDARYALKDHYESIVHSKKPSSWRCVTFRLDKSLYQDPHERNLAVAFLQEKLPSDVFVYWFRTGHVFILFEGFMRPVHSAVEQFMDYIASEGISQKELFHLFGMGVDRHFFDEEWEAVQDELKGSAPRDKDNLDDHGNRLIVEDYQKLEDHVVHTLTKMRFKRKNLVFLIICSDQASQIVLESVLDEYGEVVVAKTEEAAFAVYNERWPDLTFIDTSVHGGMDFVVPLKKRDAFADIIMVIGDETTVFVERCMKLGARGYVPKPVAQARNKIEHYIDDYRAHLKEHEEFFDAQDMDKKDS